MLEVKLLGQFDVQLDGKPVVIASRAAQSLFAYLVLNSGTPHRREQLAGLFWPDLPEPSARRNLRQALWLIRRAIAPDRSAAPTYLVTDDFSVTFAAEAPCAVDVKVLADHNSAQGLRRAVEAYRGELLPGFYEDWAVAERERLHAVFEQKMSRWLDQLIEARQWPEVLEWGERWIAQARAPEPAYRALMIAHHALGDRSGLAAAYQRCAQALRADLGLEPSAQTRALYERLTRETSTPAESQPAEKSQRAVNLPAQPTAFVGRARELTEVGERLSDPACRLLTLIGPGGIGKTRLALQSAAACAAAYPDGVHFVPLASVGAADYLASAIAEAIRFDFYGGEDAKAQLLNYLRGKQLLLIMDNFEHLLDGVGLLAELLAGTPGLKLLVTSQERLNLQGEWLFEVEGMSYPRAGDLGDPAAFGAVQLFLQGARRVDAGFALSPENAAAVVRICQLVAGMPLGLELAASWVRSLSCAEIAAEIERSLAFLTTSLRDLPERHRSLQAVFDYAWQRLSEEERRVFRGLAVCWGGFQREAAEQIAGASLAGLTALVDKSLLRRQAGGRYELHALLQKYAKSRLLESGELEAVRRRHLDYYSHWAERVAPGLRGAGQLECLAQLEAEHDNLRAALQWSLSGGALDAGLRLAAHLSRFWYLRGYWSEGRQWLERLLERSEASAHRPETEPMDSAADCLLAARAQALHGAGWLMDENGAEVPLYEESLRLSRLVGDRWGAAFSLRGLGAAAANRAQHEQAQALLDESQATFRELGDAWGSALVSFNLGWLAFARDYERAEAAWSDSQDSFQRVGDRWGTAVSLGALSYMARLKNDYGRAAALSEASLALFRELGDKAGTATSLTRLGNVAYRRGDLQQAQNLLEESLALQRELGSQRSIEFELSLLGLVACYRGDGRRARTLIEESLALGREIEDDAGAAFAVAYLGLVAHHYGESERARPLLERSLAEHTHLEVREGIGLARLGLGLVALSQGDLPRARTLLEESLELYRQLEDKRYIATSLSALSRLGISEGDRRRALALACESLSLYRDIGDKYGLVLALEGVAMAEDPSDAASAARAARLLGAAQALRDQISAPPLPHEQAERERALAGLRAKLGEAGFDAARSRGGALSPDQAAAEALQEDSR